MEKTREDYLVEYEEMALEGLKDCHQSITRNLIIAYVLASLFFIIPFKSTIEANTYVIKFVMNGNDFLFYVSICVFMVYLMICITIFRLSFIYAGLKDNNIKLSKIYSNAKVILRYEVLTSVEASFLILVSIAGVVKDIRDDIRDINLLWMILNFIVFIISSMILLLPIFFVIYKMEFFIIIFFGIIIISLLMVVTTLNVIEIIKFSKIEDHQALKAMEDQIRKRG
jgi:hypothetical protein